MDGSFDAPSIGSLSAPRFGVVFGMYGDDSAILVFFAGSSLHVVCAFKSDFSPDVETVPALHRLLHEVIRFDEKLPSERDPPCAVFGLFGIVLHVEIFRDISLVVVNHKAYRVLYSHHTASPFVQILADAELHQAVIHCGFDLRDAHPRNEILHRLGTVAPAAYSADCGHSWVVPARNKAVLYKGKKAPLAHNKVIYVETGEFVLMRSVVDAVDGACPVVCGAVILEFKGADGVGDAFDGVRDRVCEVIHGIDAPSVAGSGMLGKFDSVEGRIPHVDVGGCHVQARPEQVFALGVLSRCHLLKQTEVLFDRPVAIRAVYAGLGEGSAVLAHFLGALAVNVCKPLLDEPHRYLVEAFVVVGRVELVIPPVETKPADVALYGVYVFHILLFGVGVVQAKVAHSAVFLGKTKVEADAFYMAYVEISVRLRRESGDNLVSRDATRRQVVFYDFLYEVKVFAVFHLALCTVLSFRETCGSFCSLLYRGFRIFYMCFPYDIVRPMFVSIGEAVIKVKNSRIEVSGFGFEEALASSGALMGAAFLGGVSSDAHGTLILERIIDGLILFDPVFCGVESPTAVFDWNPGKGSYVHRGGFLEETSMFRITAEQLDEAFASNTDIDTVVFGGPVFTCPRAAEEITGFLQTRRDVRRIFKPGVSHCLELGILCRESVESLSLHGGVNCGMEDRGHDNKNQSLSLHGGVNCGVRNEGQDEEHIRRTACAGALSVGAFHGESSLGGAFAGASVPGAAPECGHLQNGASTGRNVSGAAPDNATPDTEPSRMSSVFSGDSGGFRFAYGLFAADVKTTLREYKRSIIRALKVADEVVTDDADKAFFEDAGISLENNFLE